MGTTADKLAKLNATKADLKAAIKEKGQTVGDVFSTYPAAVRAIETGAKMETVLVSNQAMFELYVVNVKDGYAIPSMIDSAGGESSFVLKGSAVIFMNSLSEPGYIEGNYESLGKVSLGFKKYNAYKVLGDCIFGDE